MFPSWALRLRAFGDTRRANGGARCPSMGRALAALGPALRRLKSFQTILYSRRPWRSPFAAPQLPAALRRSKSAVQPILSNEAEFRTHLRRTRQSRHKGGFGAGAIQQTAQGTDCKRARVPNISVLPPKLPPKVRDARLFRGCKNRMIAVWTKPSARPFADLNSPNGKFFARAGTRGFRLVPPPDFAIPPGRQFRARE